MNEKIKFEDAMTSLEKIVKDLESGTLSLDESLKAYENAMSLISSCTERLEEAEQKVKILLEGTDGTITDQPFKENNED